METIQWPDSNDPGSESVCSYRARAELLVDICSEIRVVIERLAPSSNKRAGATARPDHGQPLQRHIRGFVQQLARMEELALQLMDHGVQAKALGTEHKDRAA